MYRVILSTTKIEEGRKNRRFSRFRFLRDERNACFSSVINIGGYVVDVCAFYTSGEIFFCSLDKKLFVVFIWASWCIQERFVWIFRAEIKSLPFWGFFFCFLFFFPKWDFQNSLNSSPVAEGKCCEQLPSAPVLVLIILS